MNEVEKKKRKKEEKKIGEESNPRPPEIVGMTWECKTASNFLISSVGCVVGVL